MDLNQWDYVIGRFQPKRLDTLKAGLDHLIGKEGVFMVSFDIEDGVYEGQWSLEFPKSWLNDVACWAPQEDIDVIRAATREEVDADRALGREMIVSRR